MKDLTIKEFYMAPPTVQAVYVAAAMKMPISLPTYNLAIKLHPEFFAKEIENQNKWDACDKQAFFKEMDEMRAKLYSNAPPCPGLLAFVNNTNSARVYNEFVLNIRPTEIAEEKRIKQKYGLL